MAKNDYRGGRKQLNLAIDSGVAVGVKCAAGDAGVSVTAWIEQQLRGVLFSLGYIVSAEPIKEPSLFDVVEVVENKLFPAEGNTGKPDWDAIMAAGAKPVRQQPALMEIDPIEDIA